MCQLHGIYYRSTGLQVCNVKILRQRNTGFHKCKKTAFGLHQDNGDKKKSANLSIIILLTKIKLSMCILTKSHINNTRHEYTIIFPLILFRESIYAEEHTKK